ADEVMEAKPDRLPPSALEGPREAVPPLRPDWAIVPSNDPDRWGMGPRHRGKRNMLIRGALGAKRSVWHGSSGNGMRPLGQGSGACAFRPIQAATAEDGCHSIGEEGESEPNVGDIAFCLVDEHWDEKKYWIGNIQKRCNGRRFRGRIFGAPVGAQ
ncbi:unnamed protein product, partial [Prorocentrum cordatum]